MIPRRLSSSKREQLYDAEAAKARELGRGDLPLCNICDGPIDGRTQAWDESHQKHKPRWLGGGVEGIAHRKCNRAWNNRHDTPGFHKNNRQRRRAIGATVSDSRPLIGTIRSGIRKPLKPFARPVDRATGREL